MKKNTFKLILLLHIIFYTNHSIGIHILDQIVAIVNEDIILESDIKKERKLNNQYEEKNLYTTHINKNSSQQEILNKIIADTLILQLAQQANIEINEEQISTIFKYMTVQNNMTEKQFLSYLKNKKINQTDYINYIRKNTIINTICDYEMHQRIKILPYELKILTKELKIKNNNTIFQIDHILIPLQENANNDQINQANTLGIFLTKEIQHGTTVEQLKNLYTKNKQSPTFKISKINGSTLEELPTLFSKNLIKQKKIKINSVIGPIQSNIGFHILKINNIESDGKKNTIKNIHIRHILIKSSNINDDQKIQTQLLKIIQLIENKKTTFSIQAQKISEDLNSSNNGGDLGWKCFENLDEKIQETLKPLKIGDISPPIKTNYGWHIIQLINTKIIDEIKFISQENAYQTIFNQKIDTTMKTWIQELKKSTYIKILNNDK